MTFSGNLPVFVLVKMIEQAKSGLLAAIVTRVIAPHKRALLLFTSLDLATRYIDERNHIGVHSPAAIATSKELEEVLDHMRILGITETRLDPSKTNSFKITSEEMLISSKPDEPDVECCGQLKCWN